MRARRRRALSCVVVAAALACAIPIAAAPSTAHAQSDGWITISPTGTTHDDGRAITPVCMDGSPFHFFARQGTVNKLLVYYQGGGACWDATRCAVPLCKTTVDPDADNPANATEGLFDLSNPANPFRDWSMLFVPYCSCDIHFGDAARDYPPHVEHRGWHNARIAEIWARDNLASPEQVFVTGSSAGGYGAFFNAPELHAIWPDASFQVLSDAGNGVSTTEFLATGFTNWNFDAHLPDVPGVREAYGRLEGIVGYTRAVTAHYPDTRWAHYSTAFDGEGGQTALYNLMRNGNSLVAGLTWWEASCDFYAITRAQFRAAARAARNYRYYIGAGTRHMIWPFDVTYTDRTGGVPPFIDWVRAMLDGSHAWRNVECRDCGVLLPGDNQPPEIPTPPFFAD
jgi:hypothetical protein